MNKKAKNSDEAWKIQNIPTGPHGWIQWKGTDVCMDVHCKCGKMFHIDDDFVYYVKCPHCKTVFMCNGHVELIELEEEPKECVVSPTEDEEVWFSDEGVEEAIDYLEKGTGITDFMRGVPPK